MSVRTILLLSISILLPQTANAIDETEAAARYNAAGQRYQEQNYTDALALYEALIDEGVEHPDVYYNASNAAYRAGELGKAVLYIERSLRLHPGDRDAQANRVFLNSVKADREPTPDNPIVAMLTGLYEASTIHRMAVVSLSLWIIALLAGTGSLFVRKWRRGVLVALVGIAAVAWMGSTGILVQKLRYRATVQEAVVMRTEVSSYSGPGTENTRIFSVHEGTMVVIERTEGDWALIRLKSGAAGWIEHDSLETI